MVELEAKEVYKDGGKNRGNWGVMRRGGIEMASVYNAGVKGTLGGRRQGDLPK